MGVLGEIVGVRVVARVRGRGREANLSLLFPLAHIFRSRIRLSFLTFLLLLLDGFGVFGTVIAYIRAPLEKSDIFGYKIYLNM